MKNKKVYVVSSLKRTQTILVYNRWEQALDLTNIAPGCVGVLPCFSSKKAARKYAGKKLEVLEFDILGTVEEVMKPKTTKMRVEGMREDKGDR